MSVSEGPTATYHDKKVIKLNRRKVKWNKNKNKYHEIYNAQDSRFLYVHTKDNISWTSYSQILPDMLQD
jgi:hypothetical protein